MMLWLFFALMTAGAVFAVCWPLLRRRRPIRSGNDVAVYRDQLDEIKRDETTGLIGKAEAEAARIEVSRRLIAAAESAKSDSTRTESPAAEASARPYRLATFAAAVLVLPLCAGALYFALGSPNLKPVSMMSEEAGKQSPPDGIEQTVAEVEAYLAKNPNNAKGWEVLAPVYIRLGRFDEAVKARRKALEIAGPDAAHLGDLGEALYMAAGGVVTPEAKELFRRAEAADPQDVMAQYYLGMGAKQEGRRDEAVKRWQGLINSAPPGAEYLPLIKRALSQVDEKPNAAAAAATPEHNGSTVDAMVERLAERLKKDSSDVAGWIQLVRSYRVLGKSDKATAAIADARAALGNNPDSLQQFDEGLQALLRLTPEGGAESNAAPAAAPGGMPPGPSADQMAAADKMTPTERNGMIDGMVGRLAERLKKDGSDVAGWIQLVRSYRVLGKSDQASAAIADARTALAGNPEGLRQFDEALQSEGPSGQGAVAPSPAAPAAAAAGGVPPGPNAGDIAAAEKMAPAARNEMIEGMVARLAQKMAENGADVEGWLRLIRSYSVLGQRDKAIAAAANARTALAGNTDDLRRIGDLTKELGLEGS